MKKAVKVISVLMALVLIVASFAACSGSTQEKVKVIDIKITDESYAFGVDKNQPELLKQVNDYIKEIKENGEMDKIFNKYFGEGEPTAVESATEDPSKDQLVVATNAAFEPFEYMKGNKYYGIDMEIAAGFAKKIGKELVIKNMDFDAVCLSVGQHKCDIAMAGLTVSEDRQQYVTFSDAYYQASQKLVVKGDDTTFDNCKTKEDVEKILNGLDKNVKIGGQQGTTANSYVEGSESLEFAGLKATFAPYKSASLAVSDLINGNINYVMVDEAPANAIVKSINEMA